MDAAIEGGCRCGAVRYRATAAPRARTLCHCHSCRRASAAPSVAWTVFAAADLRFFGAEPMHYASSPGVERTFCGVCGTPLAYRSTARPDVVDVTTLSLDRPDEFAPTKEIWTAERVAWATLDPVLPHFAGSSAGAVPESL